MTTIVTRAGKGSPLTHTEVDTNFTNLNTNKLETAAIPLGTLAAPSISFLSDANTGIYSPAADTVAFVTAGSNRVHITSGGLVGIGTSSPNKLLHMYGGASDTEIRLQSNSGTEQNAYFALRNSGGKLDIYSVNGDIALNPGNSVAATFKSDGKVGIGTTSPEAKLTTISTATVNGVTSCTFRSSDNINSSFYIGHGAGISNLVSDSALGFGFNNGGTYLERARIDTSGRLLVGTSSGGSVARLQVQGSTSFNDAFVDLCYNGSASSVIAADTILGLLRFTDQASNANIFGQISCVTDAATGSNDFPGRLVFSTTADGASSPTERMRITSGNDLVGISAADSTHAILAFNRSAAGTTWANFIGKHSATGPYSGGTNSVFIWSNGNLQNTNNSYTGISDIKLKENIVDASSQWNDLKALQVRKYNFKEETGHETHTQIGLVAQEVELVSPGLVGESPDRDEEGNDLGTVTKSVNYSVLYMKAVKALQEAMGRIETLEQRLTAAGID